MKGVFLITNRLFFFALWFFRIKSFVGFFVFVCNHNEEHLGAGVSIAKLTNCLVNNSDGKFGEGNACACVFWDATPRGTGTHARPREVGPIESRIRFFFSSLPSS